MHCNYDFKLGLSSPLGPSSITKSFRLQQAVRLKSLFCFTKLLYIFFFLFFGSPKYAIIFPRRTAEDSVACPFIFLIANLLNILLGRTDIDCQSGCAGEIQLRWLCVVFIICLVICQVGMTLR